MQNSITYNIVLCQGPCDTSLLTPVRISHYPVFLLISAPKYLGQHTTKRPVGNLKLSQSLRTGYTTIYSINGFDVHINCWASREKEDPIEK